MCMPEMMADIMIKFERELKSYVPDFVLVPGDVKLARNSCIQK